MCGPGARSDIDRRLQTTGHILEWLAFSLPEEELKKTQMIKAANYLSGILLSMPHHDWEIGPLGHALHALAIYDERLFKASEEAAQVPVAENENTEERSPKAIDQKPTPAAIVDRAEPKLLDAKPAPQELEAQPAPKAIVDRPAPQAEPGEPNPLADDDQSRPTTDSNAKTIPPAQAGTGSPAPLDATPAPTAGEPAEKPSPAADVPDSSARKVRYSPLLPQRGPTWRR